MLQKSPIYAYIPAQDLERASAGTETGVGRSISTNGRAAERPETLSRVGTDSVYAAR